MDLASLTVASSVTAEISGRLQQQAAGALDEWAETGTEAGVPPTLLHAPFERPTPSTPTTAVTPEADAAPATSEIRTPEGRGARRAAAKQFRLVQHGKLATMRRCRRELLRAQVEMGALLHTLVCDLEGLEPLLLAGGGGGGRRGEERRGEPTVQPTAARLAAGEPRDADGVGSVDGGGQEQAQGQAGLLEDTEEAGR